MMIPRYRRERVRQLMHLLNRAIVVLASIIAGVAAINYFVLGNQADFSIKSARIGEWRKAEVRPACFRVFENIEADRQLPALPQRDHRVNVRDFYRARELTAALNCYVVDHPNAICEPNNRAYIVDYIGKYYTKMDEMLDAGRRYGRDEVENVREIWDSAYNRSITKAIAFDIESGRLNKPDFGWSVPDAIKPLLDQYNNAADTCPPQIASK
jgi:hypothetical protein